MDQRTKDRIEKALTSTTTSNRANSEKLMEKFPQEEIEKLVKKAKDGVQNTN